MRHAACNHAIHYKMMVKMLCSLNFHSSIFVLLSLPKICASWEPSSISSGFHRETYGIHAQKPIT